MAASPRRVVIVDEDVPETSVPKIFVENEQGGYAATRHLVERGHRHIAHIGGPPRVTGPRGHRPDRSEHPGVRGEGAASPPLQNDSRASARRSSRGPT